MPLSKASSPTQRSRDRCLSSTLANSVCRLRFLPSDRTGDADLTARQVDLPSYDSRPRIRVTQCRNSDSGSRLRDSWEATVAHVIRLRVWIGGREHTAAWSVKRPTSRRTGFGVRLWPKLEPGGVRITSAPAPLPPADAATCLNCRALVPRLSVPFRPWSSHSRLLAFLPPFLSTSGPSHCKRRYHIRRPSPRYSL